MTIALIVAIAENRVIGNKNQLPWHLPADLKYFKSKTMGNAIAMGRKTYESIGKPLPGRRNIVVTRNKNWSAEGIFTANSLEDAIENAKNNNEDTLFIIGGAELYQQAIEFCEIIYLTEVKEKFTGDVYFPEIKSGGWKETSRVSHHPDEKNKYPYDFVVLEKISN